MPNDRFEVLVPDLFFPEGLRWHEDELWFSDVFGNAVFRVVNGVARKVADVPGMPSGLGWLPDGSAIAVSCQQRALLRVTPSGETEMHADLGEYLQYDANDMVVDPLGRAYVGNYGYDVEGGDTPQPTHLLRVDLAGKVTVEAPEVTFPNGAVLTNQGRTLIVAETSMDRLVTMSVAEDGSLSAATVFAEMPKGFGPDGIDVDADGGVWVAGAWGEAVRRYSSSGSLTHRLDLPGVGVYCCVLGGQDGRTLFVATASTDEEYAARVRTGQILTCRVDVPAVGAAA